MKESSSPILPSRVVNVVGAAHRKGKMNFADLNWDKQKYDAKAIYEQSKLALLLFTKELAKKTEGIKI